MPPEDAPPPEHTSEIGRRVTDFDNSVPFLLTSLSNKFNTVASRRLRRRVDVGLMEWRTLALLAVERSCTPARVAQVAGVDKSVVSRAVTSLERRGLIRVEPGPQAGRQTRLVLTAEGEDLHSRGMEGVIAAEATIMEGFDPEERKLLVDFLKRLTANVAHMS